MPGQVDKSIKSHRGQQLSELEAALRRKYFQQLAGTPLRVLVEGVDPESSNRLVGTSCRYAPVEFEGSEAYRGALVDVTAGAVAGERIQGRMQNP